MKRSVLVAVFAGMVYCAVTVGVAAETRSLFNGDNFFGWNANATDLFTGDCVYWTTAKDVRLDPNNEYNLELIPFASGEARTGGVIINNKPVGRSNIPLGLNIVTNERFGSAVIELEVMVPKGSNSGIYLLGEYEVQVFDSFGKPDNEMTQGDFGAIYGNATPKVNASTAPGTWQKVLIDYDVAQWDASGNKVAKMKVNKVVINGKVVQENVEVAGPTQSGITGAQKIETAYGPLMLQGDHGQVAYRRIMITEKNPKPNTKEAK